MTKKQEGLKQLEYFYVLTDSTDIYTGPSVFLAWFMHSLIPEIIMEHLLFSWPGLGAADTLANRMDKLLVLVSIACSLGKQITDKYTIGRQICS